MSVAGSSMIARSSTPRADSNYSNMTDVVLDVLAWILGCFEVDPVRFHISMQGFSRFLTFAPHDNSENGYSWDMDHASPPEQIIAHCASYKALERYLSGRDLVILPRNRRELEGVL